MSKQLKLKFKKILKKADFTHADLEYHEELLPEAKQYFADTITKIIEELSEEDKTAVRTADDRRQKEFEEELDARRNSSQPEDSDVEANPPSNEDVEEEENNQESEQTEKESELKNLFRRIAALTHPDKAIAKGISNAEKLRLEKIFMRAKKAYDDRNWYILYSIAFDLNLELPDPGQDSISWVEGDIQNTLEEIARIAGTIVWVWYTGDDAAKLHALKCYFQQNYGLDLIEVND